MTPRQVLYAALALTLLAAVCVFTVDGPAAMAARDLSRDLQRAVGSFTTAVEIAFAFPIGKFLIGLLLVVAGGVLAMMRKRVGWLLLFVGASHVTARFIAGVLKTVFARIRPYEAITASGWNDDWFAEVGNAFPSGHAAHFWGFFFPLAMLFPRWRIPLVILPVLVSASRVMVSDHYVADVVGSAAIAAFVTLGFSRLLRRRYEP